MVSESSGQVTTMVRTDSSARLWLRDELAECYAVTALTLEWM